MTRRTVLIGLGIIIAVVGGFESARAVRGTERTQSTAGTRSTVDVGSNGDPITAVRFDFLPEGTVPVPFLLDSSEPGSVPLRSITDKLPKALPDPDPTPPIGSCPGLAVRFQLRSGRDLYYLPCQRPEVVSRFLASVGAVSAG